MSDIDKNLRIALERQTKPVVDDDITRIKELFADAGYIPGDAAGMAMALGGYLQGRDWYDRFEKEYNNGIRNNDVAALDAAKRASGIA